jgi:ABC-type glycerol-3-phosphate transport system substrate-binding protein
MAAAQTGCAPGAEQAPSATEPAGQISFWHWGSQDYYVRYRALAEEFQKRSPKITVEVVLQEPIAEKLLAAISGGAPPNTFVHDFQRAQGWGKMGLVEALDDRAKRSRVLKMGEYSKLALDAITYKGKLQGLPGVGIPGGAAPNLVFYNADHFRKEGLATPYELWKQDKWDWAAFVNAAEKLVKRGPDGKMTQVPTGGRAHRLFMNAAGGKEADDVFAPTKSVYDDPKSVKALQFLQDLRHKQRVEPVVSTNNEIGLNDDQAFMEGRLSMRFRWTTGINVYRPINSFKWGMAPYPKDATYATDYTAAGLSIAKGATLQDAAWAWIEWASSPDGQKLDAQTTTGVPFNPDAQRVFRDSLKGIPNLETPDVAVELINNARITFLRLLCVDEAKIHGEVINPEVNRMLRNEVAAQTAATSIAQAMNDFLKSNPQT